MQEKLLKKIISDFAGPESEKLVDLLFKKQNVNEFLIAKKLNLTINQTRNTLYKLADEGLVQFIRKKDKKKGGWYTYFWTLKIKRSLQKYKEDIDKELRILRNNLEKLQKEHRYHCQNCEIEYNEEDSLIHEYTCPECGEILKAKETTKVIEHINNETKKLQETLSLIGQEIEKIEDKEEKIKERKLKAEQKKKELERKKKRAKREREKKKLAKKTKKKPKKKKKIKKRPKKKTKQKPKKSRKKPKKKTAKFSKKKKKK